MSKKYLINKYGEPAECKASKRDCSVGGEHFSSLVSAYSYSDRTMKTERFPSLSKSSVDRPKKNFKEKAGDFIDEKFDITTTGGVVRGVWGDSGWNNNTCSTLRNVGCLPESTGTATNSTPYSVSATVKDTSSGHTFRGVVMDSHLKKSNFDHCVKDADKKNYVVCKTSDGKFTLQAKDTHETSTHTTIIGKSIILTTSNKDMLTNMSLKDNQNGRVLHLNTHEVGNSTNYYIPMSSVTK